MKDFLKGIALGIAVIFGAIFLSPIIIYLGHWWFDLCKSWGLL